MSAVEWRMGCPKRMRAKTCRGTENGHTENLQTFLRNELLDEFSNRCFIWFL